MNVCQLCGTNLSQEADAKSKRRDKQRRRRKLKSAVKEREPCKISEATQHRRDRKTSGNLKKIRQRHIPQR
jgi:hypothetical protein